MALNPVEIMSDDDASYVIYAWLDAQSSTDPTTMQEDDAYQPLVFIYGILVYL